jgi:hypothetical protein
MMIRSTIFVTAVLASNALAVDLHVNSSSGPFFTIQSAINAAVTGDRVLVEDNGAPAVFFENIDFLGKDITVRNDPANSWDVFIDGSGIGSVVTMNSGEPLTATLQGFRVVNGAAPQGGGISMYNSSGTLRDLVVERCTGDFGAGLSVYRGRVKLENVDFHFNNNLPTGFLGIEGGGVRVSESELLWRSGHLFGNRAMNGGGLFAHRSDIHLMHVSFDQNTSNIGGGAMLTKSKVPYKFEDCRFVANHADPLTTPSTMGGGVFSYSADVEFLRCEFKANQSRNGPGGGVSARGGSLLVDECLLEQNSARRGGGVHLDTATMHARRTDFKGNQANTNGGGLQIEGNGSFAHLGKCVFLANGARLGGGLAAQNRADLDVFECDFSENTAIRGGGIYAHGKYGVRIVRATNMFLNEAQDQGGAIAVNGPAQFDLIDQSQILENTSHDIGGGIYAKRATLLIQNSVICGNNATTDGGGLFSAFCTPTVSTSTVGNNMPNDITGSYLNIGSTIGGGC